MAYRRSSTAFTRYGGWIPSDERIYRGFHSRLFQFALVQRKAFSEHEPAVQAFADAINKPEAGENKSLMRTLFDKVFLQASKEYNFFKASSHFQLRRIRH